MTTTTDKSMESVREMAEQAMANQPTPQPDAPYMSHAEFEAKADYAFPTECDGTLRVDGEQRGMLFLKCDGCAFEVSMRKKVVDPEERRAELMGRAGIPELFAGKTFDNTVVENEPMMANIRAWLRNFKASPLPAPALYGESGRGKSHLLSLIVETLVNRNLVHAVYKTEGFLFDEISGLGIEVDYAWERLLNVPVLAIDDLAASRLTEFRSERLQMLVDHRYSKRLPLLISTNVPPKKWEERFTSRTASRLRGMVVPFELKGPDRRPQGVQASFALPGADTDV
jgi:DNA replication protein DnaC